MLQVVPKITVRRRVPAEVTWAEIGPPDCVDDGTFALGRDLGVKNLDTEGIHNSVMRWKTKFIRMVINIDMRMEFARLRASFVGA
jgi:hypothetical protein